MNEDFNFYNLDPTLKESFLEASNGKGKCSFLTGGMCGEIYLIDRGTNTHPRYTCIKVPKRLKMFLTKKQQIDL